MASSKVLAARFVVSVLSLVQITITVSTTLGPTSSPAATTLTGTGNSAAPIPATTTTTSAVQVPSQSAGEVSTNPAGLYTCLTCKAAGKEGGCYEGNASHPDVDLQSGCKSCEIIFTDTGQNTTITNAARACNTITSCPTELSTPEEFLCMQVTDGRKCSWCCTDNQCNNYTPIPGRASTPLVVGLTVMLMTVSATALITLS